MATKDYDLGEGVRGEGREEGVCEGILILDACSLGCNLYWKGRVGILFMLQFTQKSKNYVYM